MTNLNTVEIKAFVPSRDYELSKRFYQTIGFEMASDFEGVAYFKRGECSFLLQDFYEKAHSENFMIHLLVEDAESWYQFISKSINNSEFSASVTELTHQPWGMLDFCLTDPSEVQWRIGQSV